MSINTLTAHRWRAVLLATAALLTGCRGGAPAVEPLASPDLTGQRSTADPALVVDAATGDIVLAWVGGDSTAWHLYVARSRDDGATWSPPVRATAMANDVHPHGEASPRLVAAPGGVIAAAWPSSFAVPGREWGANEVRFTRSTDGGRTWSPTRSINDDTARAPTGHTFHGMALAGVSGIVVAWLDERDADSAKAARHRDPRAAANGAHHTTEESDATIYVARSHDLGQTWETSNQRLWGGACPCCRVSLAGAPNGGVTAAWRAHLPGSVRDPVVASVSDLARPATRVHADSFVFNGCPHTGPAIAVDAAARTHVAWYSGAEGRAGVFYARRGARDTAFASPVALIERQIFPAAHAAVASFPDGGAIVAYDIADDAMRRLVVGVISAGGRLGGRSVVAETDGAQYPQVAALPSGDALVAWTVPTDDGGTRIRLARLRR